MRILATEIPDVKLLIPSKHGDPRGFFSETYRKSALLAAGVDQEFVQDNHSLSASKNVVRGLHFQIPPFEQVKLVRVIRGAILDVAVDLRKGSATFGRHVKVAVSAEEWNQVLIPVGFAHGFLTLQPDTEVIYKVTNYYAPDCDRGLLWNDPALGIEWPVTENEAILSAKDKQWPPLSELPFFF